MITKSIRKPEITREIVIDTLNRLLDDQEEYTGTKIINRKVSEEAIDQTIKDYDDYEFGVLTSIEDYIDEILFDYLETYEIIEAEEIPV
jgi:hypothetical protein